MAPSTVNEHTEISDHDGTWGQSPYSRLQTTPRATHWTTITGASSTIRKHNAASFQGSAHARRPRYKTTLGIPGSPVGVADPGACGGDRWLVASLDVSYVVEGVPGRSKIWEAENLPDRCSRF